MDVKIKTCPSCGARDIVELGTDNSYKCQNCGEDMMPVEHKHYYIEEDRLARFVEEVGELLE